VVEKCPFAGPFRYYAYRFTIFPGMWLVFSNAKPPLPHTATLSTFVNTDRVNLQVMILHMTLSIILKVIVE
jgi:hypothetical protein